MDAAGAAWRRRRRSRETQTCWRTRRRIAEAQGLLNQSRLRPNPGLNIKVANGSVLRSPGERDYTISYAHTFVGREVEPTC